MPEIPDDFFEALGLWQEKLARAVEGRQIGRTSPSNQLTADQQAMLEATLATAEFLMIGEADPRTVRLFLDLAGAFDEAGRGRRSPLFAPAGVGGGAYGPSVAELQFRAWAGCASLALIHAGRKHGEADRAVAEAARWIDDDKNMVSRVGQAPTTASVRNWRLAIEANDETDLLSKFARNVLSWVEAGRSADEQAAWFLAQVSSRQGHAFGV